MCHLRHRWLGALFAVTAVVAVGCTNDTFDIVLSGGRVMDPETGLDAIRHVGIRDGRIAAVSEDRLTGGREIDATGLVVAPGFIDLHQHGQNEESYVLKVQDGATTALELEVGTGDVNAWYAERQGGQIANYGVSIGHIPVRMIVMEDEGDFLPSGPGGHQRATDDDIAEMVRRIEEGLDQGAVGVGFGIAYTPATTRDEFETMLRAAKEADAPAYIHVRGGLDGLRESIDAAANTTTSLHIVHANSSGGAETAEFLGLIEQARATGQDVTTEAYPYAAGQTRIESALFDDWETWPDEQFGTFQWVETGDRLDRQSFERYRAQGGFVIIHSRTEQMTRTAIESPLTMIASDGGIGDGRGHPRSSGTYAKVLGKYVRDENVLDLMDALRKMTIEPARRLETRIPNMRERGRLQVGSWADITVFDPATVIDRATYVDGTIPSDGLEYVLVNGVLVVDQGELVEGARPGIPVRAPTQR